MDEQTRFRLTATLFASIRDKYKTMFPGREWDPHFFNFFNPFVTDPPHVIFSWNIEGWNNLVARFEYKWHEMKELFDYLKNNCDSPEFFEWVNTDIEDEYGRVFIKYGIEKIDYERLANDSTYHNSVVYRATQAMKTLEETLWTHIKDYFSKHPE